MRAYRLVLTAMVVGAALTLSACGGDDSASSSSTTAAAGATTTSTTSTTAAEDGAADLEGTWKVDAADLLAANTANVGGTGGAACSGEITMTFAATTLQRSGEVKCGLGSRAATGTIDTTSNYTVDGDKLTVSGTSNRGRLSLGGASIPTPDSWGDATATYKVVDDTLTITFTQASVGTITQKYTRAA